MSSEGDVPLLLRDEEPDLLLLCLAEVDADTDADTEERPLLLLPLTARRVGSSVDADGAATVRRRLVVVSERPLAC